MISKSRRENQRKSIKTIKSTKHKKHGKSTKSKYMVIKMSQPKKSIHQKCRSAPRTKSRRIKNSNREVLKSLLKQSPLSNSCDGKRVNFHVVLDLDNTIISSLSAKEYDENKIDPSIKMTKICDGAYYTMARPFLDDFLDYLFKYFKVSVWTAASEGYAKEIIERFITKGKRERKLEHFFYDKHCQECMQKVNKRTPKDLNYLYKKKVGFTPENTVIIDDLHEVISHNKNNVVDSLNFDCRSKNAKKDKFLLHLIDDLKILYKRICKLRKYSRKC